jgi:hypothetical protein
MAVCWREVLPSGLRIEVGFRAAKKWTETGMDADFMDEIEFDFSPEQGELLNRAITLASIQKEDDFAGFNPLIAILEWWQMNVPEDQRKGVSAESRLVEACKSYLAARGA